VGTWSLELSIGKSLPLVFDKQRKVLSSPVLLDIQQLWTPNKNEGLCADARHLLRVTQFRDRVHKVKPMERDYDIFEVLPDGQPAKTTRRKNHT
jgi:hypothetical protein